jgi:hypothetical protein
MVLLVLSLGFEQSNFRPTRLTNDDGAMRHRAAVEA